jgi:hypothetical protein
LLKVIGELSFCPEFLLEVDGCLVFFPYGADLLNAKEQKIDAG